MKISASIYARHRVGFSSNGKSADADEHLDVDPARPLRDTVRMLDEHGVDYFHIDCRDDHAVFEDIKLIRTVSDTPIDLHLITPDPEPYYPAIREFGIECVSVQLESLQQAWDPPADLKKALGLAMISDTSIDAFSPFADSLSFVLFMTTTPGQSGGEFHNTNFRRIREFQAQHPGVRIHVDGGVNQEVSFILRNMGVYSAVSGSYLLPEKEAVGPRMLKLTRSSIPSSVQSANSENEQTKGFIVADFMMERHEIP
ncbi:MAG: ribulose-phosphate 3-epimerase, partial [Limisphaerales bacterium]